MKQIISLLHQYYLIILNFWLKISIITTLFFVVEFSSLQLYAQEDEQSGEIIEQLLETTTENDAISEESTLLSDDLTYYSNHPININRASEEELLRLCILDFTQVKAIISYREKYGSILSRYELSVLNSFSEELIDKMIPFIQFNDAPDTSSKFSFKNLDQKILFRIKTSYPRSQGFSPQKDSESAVYPGTPYAGYLKYKVTMGDFLEIGFTSEKDAGEEFFKKTNSSGFDFYSGYIVFKSEKILRRLVIGDYHLRFGQGVSLWSGGGVGYGSNLYSSMKSPPGIRPYSSSDENQFFRGAALQFGRGIYKLSLFASSKHRDANTEMDSIGNLGFTSLKTDGLHRTDSELFDEKTVRERIIGAYNEITLDHFRCGLSYSYLRFDIPMLENSSLYKTGSFYGNRNMNSGFDYQWIKNGLSVFGEIGFSQNLKFSLVQGVLWKVHPALACSFLYRHYDPAFQSLNTGAFSQGTATRNEEGFYTAVEILPFKGGKIIAGSDLYYYPWVSYQTIAPAKGRSWMIQFDYRFSSSLSAYILSKFRSKPQKITGSSAVSEEMDESNAKLRVHLDWKITPLFQLRSRIEMAGYQFAGKSENGFLVFQDFIFSSSKKFKAWMRFAYFNTDGYNSRVYSYENDLLYYFYIPEFHGKGERLYINIKWQPYRMISLYMKAGLTHRKGVTTFGSGNDETIGSIRYDLRGQMNLRF